ncbi:MAG: hypothetical protein E7575_00465 [Ruminococcaceae bacterium]|nr:hypothetical protein [Oscillospiraceae bacterium]
MKKSTKLLSLILAAILAMGAFASCNAKKEDKKYTIREDIIEAFELDEDGKQLVYDTLDAFNKAFDDLKAANPVDDSEFGAYGEAIDDALSAFYEDFAQYREKLTEKMKTAQGTEKDNLALLSAENTQIAISLSSPSIQYMMGNVSGESFSEDALNCVIDFSEFFTGESIITNEMIDSIIIAD